ncbi:MAG TPA: PTS sugar transporter subunit IIA [Thermoanaerobaculia bacterium]|nr:PTS sugar transporter subunit IIA [Thermoanaerobaculia bacterium]
MRLGSLTRPDLIFLGLPATDRKTVLHALAGRVAERGLVTDPQELYSRLWEREQLGSTAVGAGVAIPHCKLAGLARGIVALGVTAAGVDFAAVDGRPVRLFFLVVSPVGSPGEHLQALAAISRWVKADGHVARLLALSDREAIYNLLEEGS